MIAAKKPDIITQRWMRDASDEYAVSEGCWFDEGRGQFTVDWLRDYLVLYEGEDAGKPFECFDWQYEATMRLFGWVRKCPDWGGERRRFKKASIWVAKKNKKSPTLAAWCIYMFAGDGVLGQKCFPTAVDGAQIRENVGRHIHEMIRQSEALSAECKINKNTCSVFHEPTRSLIMPLSSDNVRTQKAKEGLNGSLFKDEVHVIDKRHARRISRAGISRPEPLDIEVSTAGDEPESYGMGRFHYAEGIISGAHRDYTTLAIIHAAPQEISDEEIHSDPVKYGKMANPSWGHTVKETEFLNDYDTSKKSIAEFADFKKYRLNIWQQATSPWISVHDWDNCPATEFELDPSATIYGGLDLSRTTDLTAWIKFQPGDTPKCWGHYWCPRQRAMELSSQFEIPLLDWEDQGWVTLNEDRIIDRDEVHEKINKDSDEFRNLRYIGYDPYNADATVKFCIEQLGLEMVEVKQGMGSLSAPTKAMQEFILLGMLDHSMDPVLRWMLQNTSVETDKNGNIRPIKTVGGVRKHIDGIVALIMAQHVAMCNPNDGPSIYETPGMLAL